MYGIFTNICPNNGPNVGKYPIHGAYGINDSQVPGAALSDRVSELMYLQTDRMSDYIPYVANICPKHHTNVGNYTIHRAYGYVTAVTADYSKSIFLRLPKVGHPENGTPTEQIQQPDQGFWKMSRLLTWRCGSHVCAMKPPNVCHRNMT